MVQGEAVVMPEFYFQLFWVELGWVGEWTENLCSGPGCKCQVRRWNSPKGGGEPWRIWEQQQGMTDLGPGKG